MDVFYTYLSLGIGLLIFEVIGALVLRLFEGRAHNQSESHPQEDQENTHQILARYVDDWTTTNHQRHRGDWGRVNQSYSYSVDFPVVVNSGLLLYRDRTSNPIMHHATVDLTDYAYVRPFAVFNIAEYGPSQTRAVRFEIRLGTGERLFNSLQLMQLDPGDTPLLARHWLPITDANLAEQNGQLYIYCEGALLRSKGLFFCNEDIWDTFERKNFRQYLDGDGELSDQLLAVLDDAPAKRQTSLDELLR